MLPFGSIFFPLTVAPFKIGFSQRDYPPKIFINIDTNILWMSVYLLHIVN